MNKFFHKSLQHSVGITGIAIIYLALSLIPDFLYNLWTFALSHPLSAGLMTGMPLIPLLMSSKQKRVYQMTDQFAHTDFAGVTELVNKTIDHSLAGWIQKVNYIFAYDTPFNNNVAFSGYSYVDNTVGGVGSPADDAFHPYDMLNQITGSTEIVANRTHIRPFLEVYQSSQTGDTIAKHTITMMEWVDVGSRQYVKIAGADIGTAPTGGVADVRIEVIFIVAAFGAGRSKKQPSHNNYLLIYGTVAGSANQVNRTFIPETDLRLYSIMGLYWGLTIDDESFMTLTDEIQSVGQYVNTGTTLSEVIKNKRNIFYLGNDVHHKSDTTTTDQDQYLGLMRFKKTPIFMKKRQPWKFSVNNESGNDNWFYLSAQVMPDYQNAVDWFVELDVDESADSWEYFVNPYDIYLTSVKYDIVFTVLAAQTGNTDTPVDISLLGPHDEIFDASSHGYGFLEYPEGSTAADAVRHSGVLERVHLTAPPADVYGGGTGKTTSYVKEGIIEVNEYMPRGAKIGLISPALSTLSDVKISLQIEGVVAKKTGRKDALAFQYTNEEILNVDTLEGANSA